MMKKLFERLTGIDKIKAEAAEQAAEAVRVAREAQQAAEEAEQLRKEAEAAAKKAAEQAAEKKKQETKAAKLSPKEAATAADEPYVSILSLDIDADNPHRGAFELDWNDKFVANLVRAGYQGKTDADIVDQWFQNVCRHVVMETWEQEQAINPSRYTTSRDLGDGRREIS